jgi:hypothetical protein
MLVYQRVLITLWESKIDVEPPWFCLENLENHLHLWWGGCSTSMFVYKRGSYPGASWGYSYNNLAIYECQTLLTVKPYQPQYLFDCYSPFFLAIWILYIVL